MVAYKHLVVDPIFECDHLLYVRIAERRAVVLKHHDGTPVRGFQGNWRAAFLYAGFEEFYFLGLEDEAAQATWILSPDGRRLGDKMAHLAEDQRMRLRHAVVSRGLDRAGGLLGDGVQFIEAGLRDDILGLPETAATPAAIASDRPDLAMLAAPRSLTTVLRCTASEAALRLLDGWAVGESGIGRAVGNLSLATGDIVPAASRYLLTLALLPVASQTAQIEISVNGGLAGALRLDPHWQAEGAEFAFWLPPERLGGNRFEIAFRHTQEFVLDALRLEQGRAVSVAELDPREVMSRFENIGDNCEFGLVQRHFNAEPVGLLRFAGLRNPRRLIRFLEDDFGAFGEPGSLATTVIGGEYWIKDTVYGIAYHTFRYKHEVAAEEVIKENEIKASYLKRKFREDLEDGRKILVYKRVVTQDAHEMLALHAALNRFGTVNPLFWVTQSDEGHAPGDVEWVGERLLKGYVGRISLENAHDFDAPIWLRLCRNALAAFAAVEPG